MLELTKKTLFKYGYFELYSEENDHISKGKNGEVPSIFNHKGALYDLAVYEDESVYLVSVFKPYEHCEHPSYKFDYQKISNQILYLEDLKTIHLIFTGKELTLC